MGGFLKGLFTSTGRGLSKLAISVVNNPVNNINITILSVSSTDSIKQIKDVVVPTLENSLSTFIDNLGPTQLAVIGVVIWILKFGK